MSWENPNTSVITRLPSTPKGACDPCKETREYCCHFTNRPNTIAIFGIDFSACSGTYSWISESGFPHGHAKPWAQTHLCSWMYSGIHEFFHESNLSGKGERSMQWNVVSGRPLANPALVILHVIYKKEFRLPQQVPDFSHCGVQQDRLRRTLLQRNQEFLIDSAQALFGCFKQCSTPLIITMKNYWKENFSIFTF